MSYLRGPLTREQIRKLSDATRPAEQPPQPATPRAAPEISAGASPGPPAADPGVWQLVADPGAGTLHPSLGLRARATLASRRPVAEAVADFLVSVPLGPDGTPSWKHAAITCDPADAVPPAPHGGSVFAPAPGTALQAATQSAWQLEARRQLGESLEVTVLRCGRVTGRPFETEMEFRRNLEQAAREQRDEEIRRLRQKFAAKTETAAKKIARCRDPSPSQ